MVSEALHLRMGETSGSCFVAAIVVESDGLGKATLD
jgi:hypothetical protein